MNEHGQYVGTSVRLTLSVKLYLECLPLRTPHGLVFVKSLGDNPIGERLQLNDPLHSRDN